MSCYPEGVERPFLKELGEVNDACEFIGPHLVSHALPACHETRLEQQR